MIARNSLIALSAAALVQAAVTPLTPAGAPEVGSDLDIQWKTDSTGDWTSCQIDFMSGDNWNMINLETVATDIDCTTQDSLSWTVPDVTIYANVYFFQFTMGGDVSTAVWTTRFPIASSSGATSAPPESIQPDGQTIGWGSGALAGQTEATSVVSLRTGERNPGSATASAMTASSTAASSGGNEDDDSSSAASPSSTSMSSARRAATSSSAEDDEEAEMSSSSEEATTSTREADSSSSSDSDSEGSGASTRFASATGLALALISSLLFL